MRGRDTPTTMPLLNTPHNPTGVVLCSVPNCRIIAIARHRPRPSATPMRRTSIQVRRQRPRPYRDFCPAWLERTQTWVRQFLPFTG